MNLLNFLRPSVVLGARSPGRPVARLIAGKNP